MAFKVSPYKETSSGAKILARELGAQLLQAGDVGGAEDVTINWGCGWTRSRPTVNSPRAVCNAVNKVRAFSCFDAADVPHPEHTTRKATAMDWFRAGFRVYHRDTMDGERGRGITIIDPDEADEDGTGGGLEKFEGLSGNFTRGFDIKREFRVHVAFGKVIEVNEKKRRNGTNPDPRMRSHRDWVFCVYNLAPYPEIIKSESIKAVKALGLDFGGVDIAISGSNEACVFEVNSAPWINRESTWTAYSRAITEQYPDQN